MARALAPLVTRWVDEALVSARARNEAPTTVHLVEVVLRPGFGVEAAAERHGRDATKLLGSRAQQRALREVLVAVRAAPRDGEVGPAELLDAVASSFDATMYLLAHAEYERWEYGDVPPDWGLAGAAARVDAWASGAEVVDPTEALLAAARRAGTHAPQVLKVEAPDSATAARVLWQGFSGGWLRPVPPAFWRAMAVPGAYDESDARRLLAFLHAEYPALGTPGEGVPAGWRSGLEDLVRGLPSSEGLRAWAEGLPSPWREGLAYGIEAAVRNGTGPARWIADEEPDWATLFQRTNDGLETWEAVAAALAARGWYSEDAAVGVPALPWIPTDPPAIPKPKSARADPAPPIEVDPDRLARAVDALSGRLAGRELAGPPDYAAVALRCAGWTHGVDTHGIRIRLVDLPDPGGVAVIGRGPEGARIEVRHRGGRAAVWGVGGLQDEEHGLPPRLLARDFLSFAESDGATPGWAPGSIAAAALDARGDVALARWLAALPRFARVIDLRDARTPVTVPGDALDAGGSAERYGFLGCGEVLLAALPSPGEAVLLAADADEGTVDRAARKLGIHPLALHRRLARLRSALRG